MPPNQNCGWSEPHHSRLSPPQNHKMKSLSVGSSEGKGGKKRRPKNAVTEKMLLVLAARCSFARVQSEEPCGALLFFLVFVSDLGRWSRRVVGLDFPRLSQPILAAAPTASIISQ